MRHGVVSAETLMRSASRKKNPWDYAVIESFFSRLTFERLDRARYDDTARAQRSIAERIAVFQL
jgi:hypothetical protein